MARHTSIQWTHIIPGMPGSSWNPIRAEVDGRIGWMCTKVSKLCLNCYASRINMERGNLLEYPDIKDEAAIAELKKKVKFHLSHEGQTSIDWPLRTQKSRGIFTLSMSDWLGEFVSTQAAATMLAVMLLSQHHIFLPCTKRWKNLRNLMVSLSKNQVFTQDNMKTPKVLSIGLPDGKIWDMSILRLYGLKNKLDWELRGSIKLFNSRFEAYAPWPPKHILFGMSIGTNQEAKALRKYFEQIKEVAPQFRLWVSQEPAIEILDWEKLGYHRGLFEWLAWGGESGYADDPKIRRAHEEGAQKAIDFCSGEEIPLFVKQFGTVIAVEREMKTPDGRPDLKGEFIPENDPLYVREFPPIENCYFPWETK